MKPFSWSTSKNERLKMERQISFDEEAEYYFLKTVIPSRKATRDYLGHGECDG
jgi:hypothetical protein